jgi:hypothetical protein
MPGLNGLETTRQNVKRVPGTAVLIYTMDESEKVVHDILSAGARSRQAAAVQGGLRPQMSKLVSRFASRVRLIFLHLPSHGSVRE